MAYLLKTDDTKHVIDHNKALKLWNVLCGEAEPENEAQATYAAETKRLYLAWRTAPDSYIQKYINNIIPMAITTWRVDRNGMPVRPGNAWDMSFAKKWGLYNGDFKKGAPTGSVIAVIGGRLL